MAIVEERSYRRSVMCALRATLMVIAAVSCIFPLWYTLCTSLSSKHAVDAGFVTVYPIGFTLSSYGLIMRDSAFYTAFLRSVIRVVIGTPVTLLACLMLAFPLSKNKQVFRPRNAIVWLLVFCMYFSGGIVPWYLYMLKYGMEDSMIGLVLSGGLPIYYCILIMNAFRNIPSDIEEAAMIDGANAWRILFGIMIPCMLPTVATITLFVAVNYWNDYFNGMVLSRKAEHYPLMTYIRMFNANIDMNASMTTEQMISKLSMSNRALDAAKVFIALIPMLIVYPLIQRYFVSGIMIGSVKG